MNESRYALALDEARRSLDRQADDVASIRGRVTNIVVVGGLAAASIGGLASREDGGLTTLTVLGASSFSALLIVAAVALWPRRLVFTHKADVLVCWADDPEVTPDRMRRNLALYMRKHYRSNARRLDQLTVLYGVGLALLLLELVFLLLDLRGR